MIVWLENLNMEMICRKDNDPWLNYGTDQNYLLRLYILARYCESVNKFIENNLIKGDIEKEEAIKNFINYCLLVANLSNLQIDEGDNDDLKLLYKTFKRCQGIFNKKRDGVVGTCMAHFRTNKP